MAGPLKRLKDLKFIFPITWIVLPLVITITYYYYIIIITIIITSLTEYFFFFSEN